MLQQVSEPVPPVFVFAGGDTRRLQSSVQPAESSVIVGRKHLLHPIDPIRRKHIRHFDRVTFRPCHPAVEHDFAVVSDGLTSALYELEILLPTLASICWTMGDRQFQFCEAIIDVLLFSFPVQYAGTRGFTSPSMSM